MKSAHILSLALAISVPATLARAAQDEPHAGHHPAATAAAPAAKAVPGKSAADMARMDNQTKTMTQMHDTTMQMMMDRLPAAPAK